MAESSTLSTGARKRLARIKKRAIPAVVEAFERGEISAKRADLLLYLEPKEQAAELTRRLGEARTREQRHARAALAIRTYLNSLESKRPDLHQLGSIIRQALS